MNSQKLTPKEVEHIKERVLKYISVQHVSKGRDKYNTTDPKSPFRTTSPKGPSKNPRTIWGVLESSTPSHPYRKSPKPNTPLSASNKVFPSERDKNNKKLSGRSNEESFETPTEQVPLESKTNENKYKVNDSFESVENLKEETQVDLPITLEGNEKVFDENISNRLVNKLVNFVLDDGGLPPIIEEKLTCYPEDSKSKENAQLLKDDSIGENKEYVIEFNKTKKKEAQIIKVDTELGLSVSELAKKFGQTTLKKEKPQKKNENEEEDISLSMASFGGPDKKRRPQRKATIGEFLGLSNETEDEFKTRKRSYTEDEPMQEQLFRSFKDNSENNHKLNSQSDKKSLRTAEFEAGRNISEHERMKENKKVEITFTEQEENILKSKYNNLLRKLDQLKEKVKEEREGQIKPKQYDTNKLSERKREAEMLYNKYSPLKKLERIRRQKNLGKPKVSSSVIKKEEISFENNFEDDSPLPTFKRILNLEVP